ncbi:hypothetical protein BJ165DRAFT_1551557 [Panaeolus papilionaceus]|nr:hypothetical protein BJ165DRAFT_1551557 [Panaeolus papilionaceus]
MIIAVDKVATTLGYQSYTSDGKKLRTLKPVNLQKLQPIHMIVPKPSECQTETCEPYAIKRHTISRDIPQVTLLKGSEVVKYAYVLQGKCAHCDTIYAADRETFGFDAQGNKTPKYRTYLNSARYLKLGKSMWCDRIYSNAVIMGVYSFHASAAAYTQFWNLAFPASGFKLDRRHIWQAFIQESIRSIAKDSGKNITMPDNLPIESVTENAFRILGDRGKIKPAKTHSCSQCTHPYKSTADVLPVHAGNEHDVVEATVGANATVTVDNPESSDYNPVRMVVVDGIVTGPTHCAIPGCTSPLANHRGESFCTTHRDEWGNRCRHQSLWKKHQFQHSKTYLSGLRRALQRPAEREAWQGELTTQNQHEHDEEQDDADTRKHYFGSSRFYCVETLCAPCGTVIAWTLFSKAESPTQILEFLSDVYPTAEEKPDFVCIDKACMVLRTAVRSGRWEEWEDTTRFVVDSYHYINHKATDQLCRTYCNPGPADGSQPNLVVVGYNADNEPYLMRAFNTQACEQLNAWLGGFDSILKRLKLGNFQWFLHVMLYYHSKFVIKKKVDGEGVHNPTAAAAEEGNDDTIDNTD